MKDTEKILRNWNMVWNLLHTLLNLVALYFAIIINFYWDVGWNALEFNCSENFINYINSCTISTTSALGIFFHLIIGFIGFIVILCILLISIEIFINYLKGEKN